jgi:hypothetical protein
MLRSIGSYSGDISAPKLQSLEPSHGRLRINVSAVDVRQRYFEPASQAPKFIQTFDVENELVVLWDYLHHMMFERRFAFV